MCESRREGDLRAVILAVSRQRGRNDASFMAVVKMMWTMFTEVCRKVASRCGEGDEQVACCLSLAVYSKYLSLVSPVIAEPDSSRKRGLQGEGYNNEIFGALNDGRIVDVAQGFAGIK